MAQVKRGFRTLQTPDSKQIIDVCEELGIEFTCQDGTCGQCKTKIISGMENLSNRTDKEKAYKEDFGMENDSRLLCQCKIKSGLVEID